MGPYLLETKCIAVSYYLRLQLILFWFLLLSTNEIWKDHSQNITMLEVTGFACNY